MTHYHLLYRLAIRPWERYGRTAHASIAWLLDREETGRPSPPGRALDLGCGRGLIAVILHTRGWETVGVDVVPAAIDAARHRDPHGATYVVGDVTQLSARELGGRFDLFLDMGCFQGLTPSQQRAEGAGVTALASPRATLLLLAFGHTRWWSRFGAASLQEVETAFPAWQVLSVEPAVIAGLGWPLNTTAPCWYRLGLRAV
jgi:SAM-dependent methyltransferase